MGQGTDLRDRTHHCAELEARHEGQQVVLAGWVHRLRDHGGVVFIDLRDHHGVTQLVLRAETSPVPYREAKELRAEAVIGVLGRVVRRGAENRNPSIPTGDIEVLVDRLELFNTSDPLPFPVEGPDRGGEDLRLKYRYLDLRGSRSQEIFRLRHRVALAARRFLDAAGFVEIETPALTKSTPEGSREYLVPSRVNPGRFYSLPQSPQLFKQILMIAGFDRYFQIARCYRDEDVRADRQPEFTQIDLEMSFAKQEGIFAVVEGLMAEIFRVAGVPLSGTFPILDYEDAMGRYGTDKPDLRFGMEILDLTSAAPASEFPPVREAIAAGGGLRGLLLEARARLSRRELDGIGEFFRERGVPRVFWLP
ncbi:MAG: aspartate--tRNA ligase, partial [Acidobacteria bacterium]|nr:aspartate--tRNA ligase [Acidobacteriota bacterium]